MSSLSDKERSIRQRLKDDFEHYAPRCLRVRTKKGEILPFALNRSQLFLHRRLEDQRTRTGRVRALVLKARQIGISTYIGGRFYHKVSHRKGFRAFIMAHLDMAADNLFDMAKRYHESCPELVRPATGASNAKELNFSNLGSGYKVATAGSREVGRSETIQLFHASEFAFWPNAQMHAAGISQAIADAEDTEDIRESTANGIGNAFHALWKAAERGESDFEAIFIPWFWHEEYTRTPPADWRTPEAFAEYARNYELTLEQAYWAFCKNRDLAVIAGGDADELNWKFRQEYPANADEAFQTSGALSFIEADKVLRARKNKVDGYGPLILGVDPARGGGDKTALIDRQGRKLGANVYKIIDHRDLMAVAGEVVTLSKELKTKGLRKIVIDTTGLGAGLYDRLRELLGDLVEGVNFGAQAYNANKYANRRAEMWDLKRQWYDDPAGVQVPDKDDFQGDECAPIRGPGATRFRSNGQLLLEEKDKIRERLGFSPDLGDASALTFAIDMSQFTDVDWDDKAPSIWNYGDTGGGWMGA